jgi:phage terminase small subunit
MVKRLTLKQRRFIQEYLRDGNASRAVQRAYPKALSKGGRRVMGSKLLTNTNIHQEIQVILKEEGLTTELIVRELKSLIRGKNLAEKNKALRTAAEIMGLIGKSSLIMANQVGSQGVFSTLDRVSEFLGIKEKDQVGT